MAKMISPVVGRVSSEWSKKRRNPATGVVTSHAGIDIAAPIGTPVVAAFSGVVKSVRTGSYNGDPTLWKGAKSGNHSLIENSDGACQYNGHLDEVFVKVGDKVTAGQVIGTVGNTGMVTGPHLHFETWSNDNMNSHFNPRILFDRYGLKPGAEPSIDVVKPTGKPAKPSKPKAPAKKQPTNYKDLVIDGKAGATTWKAAQIVMRAIETYSGLVDGKAGPMTWKGVQSWMRRVGHYPKGYLIDGKPGKVTIKGLQRFLAGKKLYTGKIDGDFGSLTVKAFQSYLNTQNA